MTIRWTHKTKVILSVAGGLVTAFIGWGILSHEQKRINSHYAMTTMLVAKKYVGEGKPVTMDIVEEIPVPEAFLPPTALKNRTELMGVNKEPRYRTRIGVLKGEALTKSKLMEVGGLRGLSWTLPPGQTALSLRLPWEQAVGGFLQPGDWVNMYCTMERTRLVLQRLRVVAVQEKMWDPSVSLAGQEGSAISPQESLVVTLALTPREAAIAALATDKGRITLALAAALETKIHIVSPVELLELK